MAKALDFIDPDKLSMTVVLTAMNRFLNEDNGLQMAFLDGNQPDRLCAPMKDYIEARGGEVRMKAPVKEIEVDDASGNVLGLRMRDGSLVEADECVVAPPAAAAAAAAFPLLSPACPVWDGAPKHNKINNASRASPPLRACRYISAMPVDVFKRMTPAKWSGMPFFRQFDELEGIPVINLHMWFDRKLKNVDHLCFSRSPLLSVYADMSTTCREYYDEDKSMLELVFAPCSPIAGGKVNWIAKSDEEIIDATMGELERLFPTEVAQDMSKAKLIKSAVVKTPRSVYAAIPGRNKFRPSQQTPIENFVLAGDWTSQKFLGSMEGAVLGGKLAAEVVASKAKGVATKGLKDVQPGVVAKAAAFEPRAPPGIVGDSSIAFGGGQTFTPQAKEELGKVDPAQLVPAAGEPAAATAEKELVSA